MQFFQQLQNATAQERQKLFSTSLIEDALNSRLSLEQYCAFLSQAYHHVRFTVPLMMAAGAQLPERLSWLQPAICEYIEEEAGHEQWILNDLKACGVDPEIVKNSRPCQPIELMVAFLFDQVRRVNPIALFGMVNVLEGTSVSVATEAAEKIQQHLKLPNKAFSYLKSHGSLDISHMQNFEKLMNSVTDEKDQQDIIHCSKVVFSLYTQMYEQVPALGLRFAA
ncbi:TenA family transcriptional regulator [Acinetobacter soli]|uniref:TenA family transcriptional regulator n=1 Tax=Acinetobacter soli TaxID=487316 RepID=UPI000DD07B8C|nr:iron-containing redox enzyme family protein [Acinetobacter soli]RSB52615.1 biliverdin-producing heme oxygenase [Acinetobacter soli]